MSVYVNKIFHTSDSSGFVIEVRDVKIYMVDGARMCVRMVKLASFHYQLCWRIRTVSEIFGIRSEIGGSSNHRALFPDSRTLVEFGHHPNNWFQNQPPKLGGNFPG